MQHDANNGRFVIDLSFVICQVMCLCSKTCVGGGIKEKRKALQCSISFQLLLAAGCVVLKMSCDLKLMAQILRCAYVGGFTMRSTLLY